MSKPITVKFYPSEIKLLMDCLYGPGVVNDQALRLFKTLKHKLNRHHHNYRRALTERKHATD